MAGAAGLSAVGAVAGSSAARSVTRRVTVEDPYAGEDFGLMESDRGCVVTTPDGVDLVVREVGPADAPVTVVFAHGFCNNMGAFHFQRRELARVWGDQVRMVFYDQRGHGASSSAAPRTYTVAQLGCDLETVLAVMAPRGSVILVGHSMGGMTVLSHARQFPRRYGTSIVGAALIGVTGMLLAPLGVHLARWVPNGPLMRCNSSWMMRSGGRSGEITFTRTLDAYNAACRVGTFDHTALDDCHTDGLTPAKTHWARPLDTPPYTAYAVRPGVTFTYLGLKTDDTAAVRFNDAPSPNLFVAGEMMAGNVLGKGYTAGVGMSIGTAFGRIAGTNAAKAAKAAMEVTA